MTPLLLVISGLALFEAHRRFQQRSRKPTFEEQFPPISDAEFIALCRPGTKPEIALKVREIVATQSGNNYESIHPVTKFVDL